MKLLKKVVAGFLLLFGVPLSIFAIAEQFDPQAPPNDKQDALAALFVLTLPASAAGGWLAWSVHRQGQKEVRDRLNSTFYQLIQESNGQLTVLHFAMETHLPGKAAKQYLDEKAKEFQASFDVTETGDIVYHFHL